MTSTEARRPRRIIEAPAPTAPPPPPAPVQRAAERFQRAMTLDRRALSRALSAGCETASDPACAAHEPQAASHAGDGGEAVLSSPVVVAARPPAPAGRSAAAEPALSAAAARDREDEADDEPVEAPLAVSDAQPDRWARQLVHTVLMLCTRADPAIEAWTVTLPMDPQALPDTELHIALSRHRISLRFQTQSVKSVTLLSHHRLSLAALLQQALSKDRDIDIEVT